MLTFFRRIRKGLLEGGRTSKYLLYAIGEILLVMIGILLALQVNNWNEERKNRGLERTYLRDINEEFKSNKTQLGIMEKRRRAKLDACNVMETLKPFTISNWDSVKQHIWQVLGIETFDPSQSSIESLINSASLDIVKNIKLRNLLLQWSTMLEDFKEEELSSTDAVFKSIDWLNENTDRSNLSLLNEDRLIVFQNLLRSNCYWNDLLINPNSLGRNEHEELANAIDTIIFLTEPYN